MNKQRREKISLLCKMEISNPNIETLKAMAETEYLINHPEVRKTYDDVDKMMEDILG